MRIVPFAVLLAIVGMLGVWHPARVAVQTLLLLPALFPGAPDPLSVASPSPTLSEESATYSAGTIQTQFVVPADGGRHPAVALLLGVGELDRMDVALHFAQALARSGIVVSIPESSGMLAERLTFDEVDAIRVSINALAARGDVDAGRIGLIGISASGGLCLVAAAQPDLRERVRYVVSFGSYADAESLLVDVASHSFELDGDVHEWEPEQRTVDVVANALTDAGVSIEDRAELLSGPSRDRANDIVRSFAPDVRDRFQQISPTAYFNSIDAKVFVMHDRDDPFIPFTQSRDLVARAPPGLITRYTEFSIFAHVIPERAVPWQTFVPDLWRLFWHIHAVLLESL